MKLDGDIEFKECSLRYGKHQGADEVSFTIPKGSSVGLMGGAGSGKTTIIHSLLGAISPYKGEIFLNGVNINLQISLRQLRDQISIVPHSPALFKGTLAFNLDPTEQIPREHLQSLLMKSNLCELLEPLSPGDVTLDYLIEEKGAF